MSERVQVDVRTRRAPSTRPPTCRRPGPPSPTPPPPTRGPCTSGVSPRIGMPSGVSEMRPLIAYFTPDRLVADDLGHQLERVLHLRLEVRLRERELGRRQRGLLDRRDLLRVVEDRAVRVRADLEADAVLALVHEHVHVAHDRELDRASSRVSNRGTGPTSIIWCTAGVSGMCAPAMRASSGLQTPHAITTVSASIAPREVCTRLMRPCSTSMPRHRRCSRTRCSAAGLDRPLAHDRAGAQRVDDARRSGSRSRRAGSSRR